MEVSEGQIHTHVRTKKDSAFSPGGWGEGVKVWAPDQHLTQLQRTECWGGSPFPQQPPHPESLRKQAGVIHDKHLEMVPPFHSRLKCLFLLLPILPPDRQTMRQRTTLPL